MTVRTLSFALAMLIGAASAAQAGPTLNISAPTAPTPKVDISVPKVVSAHNDHVKPMMAAWEARDPSKPIRDYTFDRLDVGPCNVGFWTGRRDSYMVVPMGLVDVVDHPRTRRRDSENLTEYTQSVVLRCKNGSSCIYDSANPTARRSEFSPPRSAYTRLRYDNGTQRVMGFDNVEQYYAYVLHGLRASAACQDKPVPSSYQGGRG